MGSERRLCGLRPGREPAAAVTQLDRPAGCHSVEASSSSCPASPSDDNHEHEDKDDHDEEHEEEEDDEHQEEENDEHDDDENDEEDMRDGRRPLLSPLPGSPPSPPPPPPPAPLPPRPPCRPAAVAARPHRPRPRHFPPGRPPPPARRAVYFTQGRRGPCTYSAAQPYKPLLPAAGILSVGGLCKLSHFS